MESIRFGGRSTDGFGVGEVAAPMTVQEAARVSQGWGLPAFYGAMGAIGGGYIGFAGTAMVVGKKSEDEYWDEQAALAWSLLGGAAGVIIGACAGGAFAARYGRRQEQAANVLAQAQYALQPPAPAPVTT